jgi:AcrR family transcriptional regulator
VTPQEPAEPRPSRRAEYAEATRLAIVAAARELFRTEGYVGTRVEDIARAARVSPATVYSVTGGKQGLLRTLVGSWSVTPVLEVVSRDIQATTDPEVVLERTAWCSRQIHEQFGDVIDVLVRTADHLEDSATYLARGTKRYRAGLREAVERWADLDALREDLTPERALDVTWLYFGYPGYGTLVREVGWSYDDAQAWLVEQGRHALLRG